MDPVRLLHKDSAHGYTNRPELAFPMEPEAISEFDQNAISVRARSQFAEVRQEELSKAATRSRCNRLRELEGEAWRKAIDPTRAIAEVERGLTMLEQLVRGTAAAA